MERNICGHLSKDQVAVNTVACGFLLQSSPLTSKPRSATISTGWDPILRRWRNRMPMPIPKKCHPAISKPAGLTVRGLRGLHGAWQKRQQPRRDLGLGKGEHRRIDNSRPRSLQCHWDNSRPDDAKCKWVIIGPPPEGTKSRPPTSDPRSSNLN